MKIDAFIAACVRNTHVNIRNYIAELKNDMKEIDFALSKSSGYKRLDAIFEAYRIYTMMNTPDLIPPDIINMLKTTIHILMTEFGAVMRNENLAIPILDVSLTAYELTHSFGGYMIILKPYPILFQGRADCYQIFPMQPELAYSKHDEDSKYPHPHIYRNSLCEGEGSYGITAALNRYDLVSFYLMVDSIIRNYCESEAYAPLETWESDTICKSCGAGTNNVIPCDRCSYDICASCITECYTCGDNICVDCAICKNGKRYCKECHTKLIGK